MFATPRPCFFKGAEKVKMVGCGDNHTIILTTDGLVYATGNNSGKQLGIKGNSGDVKVPTLIEDLYSEPCNPNKVVFITCANSFTLALTSVGQVYSWGTNLYGALGQGQNNTSSSRPTLI